MVKFGASMTEWSKAMKEIGLDKLADRFFEGEEVKLAGYKALEDFGLPHLTRISMRLDEFMSNPNSLFAKVDAEKYFVNLISDKWQSRMRTIDLTREQVMEYVLENVTVEKRSDFKVTVGEYFDNLYGGNVVVNPNNSLVIEVAPGAHGNLATGLVTPIDYSGLKEVQKAVDAAVAKIPKKNGKYFQSYYEFVIVNKNGLTPIFIDYRASSIYQIGSAGKVGPRCPRARFGGV